MIALQLITRFYLFSIINQEQVDGQIIAYNIHCYSVGNVVVGQS